MQNEKDLLEENSQYILKYIQKYANQNNEVYSFINDLRKNPELEISDAQWSLIIDQAWHIAYKKAMEDSYISPEEKMDLDNIKRLHTFYNNKNVNRFELMGNIRKQFRKMVEQNKDADPYDNKLINKNSPYYIPSPYEMPTPYDIHKKT